MKNFRVLVFLALFLLAALPTIAAEPEKPVGLSGWRIGLSNSLYLTAPANLRGGGVDWDKSTLAWLPSRWSAENPDVRVEVVRGTTSRFDELRQAAFTRAGGNGSSGRNFKLDSYDTAQFSNEGKTATVVKHGSQVWAVVILPGTTPTAKAVADEVLRSLWLERVETPEWKDRVVGYSWQAELPYEMSQEYSGAANTERYRVRWNDFSVETLKGGARTDFDGTVNSQIEQMRKRADITDVRVQRFNREFGYLAKERATAVQIDFLRGTEANRVYKIATVTGYGGLFTTLTLKPKNPQHLAWAHRIMSTLRLGYGVPGVEYQTRELPGEFVSLQSPVGFRAPTTSGLVRSHIGNDERHFVFSVDFFPTVIPLVGEMKSVGELTRDQILANLLKGMGGKLTKADIFPYAVGAFPARRIRFESETKNNRMFGDTLALLTSQRLYLPLYMTGTATSDAMPQIASTWRFSFPAPVGWKQQRAGTSNFQMLLPEGTKSKEENGIWTLEANRDGVQIRIEEKRQPFTDEIYLSLDGMTTGERADNPIETHLGSLLRLKQTMQNNYGFHWARTSIGEAHGVVGWGSAKDLSRQQDTLVLQNATHSWLCEVIWNPTDKKSGETRDAILASIRCGSSPIAAPAVTPPPATPSAPPSTPAPDDTEDDGWGWWF